MLCALHLHAIGYNIVMLYFIGLILVGDMAGTGN